MSAATTATVIRRTAWLSTATTPARHHPRVSYGTGLPVMGVTARAVRIATPDGAVLQIAMATYVAPS